MLSPMSMVPGLAQGDAGLGDAGLHGLRGTTGHASRKAAGSRQLTLSRPPDSLVSGFVLSLIGAIFFTFGRIALFASESRVPPPRVRAKDPKLTPLFPFSALYVLGVVLSLVGTGFLIGVRPRRATRAGFGDRKLTLASPVYPAVQDDVGPRAAIRRHVLPPLYRPRLRFRVRNRD